MIESADTILDRFRSDLAGAKGAFRDQQIIGLQRFVASMPEADLCRAYRHDGGDADDPVQTALADEVELRGLDV